MSGEKEILEPLSKICARYSPVPKKVLELACGTGTILQKFTKNSEIYGVDLSTEMLVQAKKKIPQGTFYKQDIAKFSLTKKFDLILCMFDAINHLNSFREWSQVFKNAAKHLDDNGIFIFDINSIGRLTSGLSYPPYVKYIGKDIIILSIQPTRMKSTVDCRYQFIINKSGKTYRLYEEHIIETSFPIPQITKELLKVMSVKEVISIQMEKNNPKALRVFFVCQNTKK